MLAHFRERWPDVRFIVRTGYFDMLAQELRSGDLDLLVGLSIDASPDARYYLAAGNGVGARARPPTFDPSGRCRWSPMARADVYHRLAVQSLKKAGLDWEDVFTGPSMMSLRSAVVAGLGVMPIIRRRANEFGMVSLGRRAAAEIARSSTAASISAKAAPQPPTSNWPMRLSKSCIHRPRSSCPG